MSCAWALVLFGLSTVGILAFLWYVPWVTFLMHHWYVGLVFLLLLYAASWVSKRIEEAKRI